MRPLPLSVWKPRRTVRSASRSPGLRSSASRALARSLSSTSRGLGQVDLEQLGVEAAARRLRAAAASPPKSRAPGATRAVRRSRRPRPARSRGAAGVELRQRRRRPAPTSSASPISSASSRRSSSFCCSASRAAASAGARCTSSTSAGSVRAQLRDGVLDRIALRRRAGAGASPRRFAISGAIRRSRSGRCCSTASM